MLSRSELYKPVKTLEEFKKRLPDKVKRKRPKLAEDQPPTPKKEQPPSKAPQRKKRPQDLAQEYIHDNPLQALEVLRSAFQEYSIMFMEPIYLQEDGEDEIQRKIGFFNWNERMLTHIRQAQRIAALLSSCGLANFTDVSLKGAS